MQKFFSKLSVISGILSVGLVCSGYAFAQLSASDAWVRATVPSQTSTGAFMTLKADAAVKIVSVSTPLAHTTELHQMIIGPNDRMTMRSVPSLDLAAGSVLELKPGSYHLMLVHLKQTPLQVGQEIPLTLNYQVADGKLQMLRIKAQVRAANAQAGSKRGSVETSVGQKAADKASKNTLDKASHSVHHAH